MQIIPVLEFERLEKALKSIEPPCNTVQEKIEFYQKVFKMAAIRLSVLRKEELITLL
jgi:hypothetical protein